MKIDSDDTGWGSSANASPRRKARAGLKAHFFYPLCAACALLAGCAGTAPKVVLDPVGPAPGRVANASAGNGSLVVFSAYEVDADVNYEGTYTARYSSYKIVSADGKLLRTVANNAGNFVEHPQQIELPAGNYRVCAKANGYGWVSVPVIVGRNQVTVLHLEGDRFWSSVAGFNETNAVHLPGGQLVGWRAPTAAAPIP